MKDSWNIGHLEVASPWSNAGGVVRTVEELEKMLLTGVDWPEAGSYTMESRRGNGADGAKDEDFNETTGEMQNSKGMPNVGLDQLVSQLSEMNQLASAHDATVIYNVAPVSDSPVRETAEMVARLYGAGAKAILVNLGCPNILDDRGGAHEPMSRNERLVGRILGGLGQIGVGSTYPKVFVRLSPVASPDEAQQIGRAVSASGAVSGIWTPNTWPLTPQESRLEVGGGGKSGPAHTAEAMQQLIWLLNSVMREEMDVVLSSGVMDFENDESPRDAAKTVACAMNLGAVASAGTSFYYRSEDWPRDTYRLLERLA